MERQKNAQALQALVKLTVDNSVILSEAGLLTEPWAGAICKQLTLLADALEGTPTDASYVAFLREKVTEIRAAVRKN